MNNTTLKLPCLWVCLLFFLISLRSLQSTSVCHPNDHKVLLQIKSHFPNAFPFAIWTPKTDCCSWYGIQCYDDANPGRVTEFKVAVENSISGDIPSMLGDLPYLQILNFYAIPNLTGPIPSTFRKLTRLIALDLSSNNLTGPIPEFLSQLESLQNIDLYSNSFSGTIPSSLSLLPQITGISLFRNKLTGSIPESFGSFKNAMNLQVFDNKLSGTLPRSLGQVNFTNLYLSGNQFTGDASFLFGRDKPLISIMLNNNKFKFDFTNVELPQELIYIDISHNKIYGSLPKRLGQQRLQFIDVSHNQLCGHIPTGRRLKRFDPSRFSHNKCLCDLPLPPCK